ncbi:hypothetical protein TSAR_014182 [Trichomalopsis sarcophagae]|uniref:ABC transmembrane type-1 domain-containing protein n=1 Tax=Trichomalopsis sarcophagae TaxID=543379 RepID=A0A232EQU2_9HYME|nr:hypothetical protein TSAR_014182 [Trichomalopsis sarcophagae]
MEKKKKSRNLSPRHKANCFSRFVFCSRLYREENSQVGLKRTMLKRGQSPRGGNLQYLKPLLDCVRSGKVRASHLSFDSPSSDRSELLGNKLEAKWKKEVEDVAKAESGGPRLWRAIFWAFKWYFAQHLLQVIFLELIVSVVQPLLIVSSLDYYRLHSEPIPISHISSRGAAYAVLLSLQALLASHVRLQQRENGARLRSACASLIYRKITRLSCSSASQTTSEAIIRLLEGDVKNFDKFFAYVHNIWVTPLQVIVVTCLMYNKVGASCLFGILLLLLQGAPVRLYSNKVATGFQSKVASWTQERISITREVLRKIREAKIFCWEQLIEKSLYINRHYEIDILKIASYAKGLKLAVYVFSEYTSLFSVILVYTLLGYTAFEHEKILLVALYVYVLHESMIFTFPKAVTTLVQANGSVKRIEQFLRLEEVEPNLALSMLSNDDSSISVKDVNASWAKNANVNLLESIDVCVPPKKLYGVSGPAGAGKTSFLKLILGELRPTSGEISVNGSISYASQEPWFFFGTLRDNILCSEVYDELHYRQLTAMCGLDQVFEILPKGDETVMLSGETKLTDEQQMKINLARALYREADIYILDEIFTVLDDKVFEACMNGVLKDKTRIIVFEQDSPLLMLVDEIILFDHGQIEFQGTYESYEQSSMFVEPQNRKIEASAVEKTDVIRVTTSPLNTYHHQEKINEKEPDETEKLLTKSSTSDWLYCWYLKTGSSHVALGFSLLFCILAEAFVCGSDYWLGYWTDHWNKPRQSDGDYLFYVYSVLAVGTVAFFALRNVIFLKICLDGSEKTHNKMVSRLLRTPMRFFYDNPPELVLRRFSDDIGRIDNNLPEAMLEVSHISFALFGASLLLAVINYWSIIPICAIGFLYYRLTCLYASTIPKLRLLEHSASKKTLSQVESTISGLPTIRNSRAQRLVLRGFSARQDSRSSARNLVLSSIAGIRFWLDLLLTILGALVVVGFLALKEKEDTSSTRIETLAGIALTFKQFMVIARMARLGLKASAKVEEQKERIQKIVGYIELELEALYENEAKEKQLKSWPSKGEVKFDHLYVRYSESDEPILVNLDFTIEPGSKVLVIENAESQKSSLTSALYRLAEIEGSLIIDNIDCIENLSLHRLRQTIAYVTQESVCLAASSSPRDILDPDEEFKDDDIWDALELVDLKRSFASLDHSPFKRKLLSLARAALRKSKILVVDETAVTDDSDEVLQRLLKDNFADCTILTIAYKSRVPKLHCDKVVVISEDGEATEYECRDGVMRNNSIVLRSLTSPTIKILYIS